MIFILYTFVLFTTIDNFKKTCQLKLIKWEKIIEKKISFS